MTISRSEPLQIIHSHKQLTAFLRDDFKLLSFKRHANYKAILIHIAKRADKSKDWSCYRYQRQIAKDVLSASTESNVRTVKRAIAMFIREGWLEVIGREFRTIEGKAGKCLGRNYYRFTDKLLNTIGLMREVASLPLISLQKLWNAVSTVLPSKLSRSF